MCFYYSFRFNKQNQHKNKIQKKQETQREYYKKKIMLDTCDFIFHSYSQYQKMLYFRKFYTAMSFPFYALNVPWQILSLVL